MVKIKVVSILVLLSFISTPLFVLAQQTSDTAQAIADAKRDAELVSMHDDGTVIWGLTTFGAASLFGCLCGSFILAASRFYMPPVPPTERLIGKSVEYITFYTQTYQGTKQRRYTQAALSGCIGGTMAAGLFWGYYYPKQGFLLSGFRGSIR